MILIKYELFELLNELFDLFKSQLGVAAARLWSAW